MSAHKKHLVFACGIYPPDIGGPATYAKMLEDGLLEAQFDVRIVPFHLVRYLPKVWRHLSYTRILWRQSKNCMAIYALDPISVGLPVRIVAWLRHKPFLVRLGGDYAWEQGVQRFGIRETLDEYTTQKSHRPFLVRVMAFVQKFVVRGARLVIVPSSYLGGVVASWGIEPSKIKVIYSALKPLGTLGERKVLREDFLFEGTVISSVGRLIPWKGFKKIIDLVVLRKERKKPITLVIVGDGPDKESLLEYTKEKGITDFVRFLGPLTREAMSKIVFASDFFVLNTAYEGLSHQLLEVMDIGTPIITTNISGNRELITSEREGVLVPVDDLESFDKAITKLENNKDFANRLVESARIRVTAFKQGDVIEEMTKIFNSIA